MATPRTRRSASSKAWTQGIPASRSLRSMNVEICFFSNIRWRRITASWSALL
ncbi:MAG TPA: hypothetical protein VNA24_36235 [Hyalangium sp.]|nr:hypothetical protein [Hyalangium sp.]